MLNHKTLLGLVAALLLAGLARAEVRVFIQNTNGAVQVNYLCTAGEVVRAFALDISVDQGVITGVSDFFRGPCTDATTGYGIFPASFRDHLMSNGTNVNWNSSQYTPLAVVADNPADTLPGLNSSGVTLEFGGLWDPTAPETVPGPSGTLCTVQLSQPARVSVAPNLIRGGVISAFPEMAITPVFVGAVVGPAVISATLQNGLMTILFQGGQLQSAPAVEGPWSNTGDLSGHHIESLGTNQTRFYRVRTQ
jgi:hypothetical protein